MAKQETFQITVFVRWKKQCPFVVTFDFGIPVETAANQACSQEPTLGQKEAHRCIRSRGCLYVVAVVI